MVFLAIVLLAIPVLLRTLVTSSGRRASLTLPVFVVAIAVILLGVYFARNQADVARTPAGATEEAAP
jgi:hypothetical protein